MGLVAGRGHQRAGLHLDEIPRREELPQRRRDARAPQQERPPVGMAGPERRRIGHQRAPSTGCAHGRRLRKSLAKVARSVWCGPTFGQARHRPGPPDQSRKNDRESHRQLAPQGQYRRARRQALCRPERRKLSSRQGHADHPGRHAPDQRRRKDGAALQDHRAGRARLCGGRASISSSIRTATASIS